MRLYPLLGVALAAAVVLASCAHSPGPPAGATMKPPPRASAGPPSQSNVVYSDYAGSAACAGCHPKEASAWARSPMHNMTRDADAPDVHTPFDGRAMRFKRDTVTLETQEGRRTIRITSPGGSDQLYRVTRVVGGRTREDFVGVHVGSAGADPEEMVLPVSQLLFATGTAAPASAAALRYKGYSVLAHERPIARPGPVWAQTCIFCHNTAPFFSTIAGTLRGGKVGYQGEDVDPLLPRERRWTWSVADGPATVRAASDEIVRLGGARVEDGASANDALTALIAATREKLRAGDLVEIGIGCESCHGGAKAHLADQTILPSFAPYAPFLGLQRGEHPAKDEADAHAQSIDRACARCHQVLYSGYPWTWEGGKRRSAEPGGSPINSGEARDFLLGSCASALACTACHDPHDARDRQARNAELATPAGNPVCTRCHAELASDDALRAHAHHDPRGRGGACVACHMPRKNLGLDLRLTRYHRIGSPTDPARVLLDRPLECALCHADKSVGALVSSMETWWKKAYPRDLLTRLYGDLNARTLVATLAKGKPHERGVAAAALGELRDRSYAPAIARELVNEYPLVRGFAARALSSALGHDCPIEVGNEGAARIAEQARACLAASGLTAPAFPVTTETGSSDDDVPND